jgi:hypothetical protein
MPKRYLDNNTIQELIKTRDNIFIERNKIFELYKINVLDNDILSSLSIWEIVSQYDSNYNINFARTGEDAISNDVIIEQKCSFVDRSKNNPTFKFHAKGNINYPRYIFAIRLKHNLKMLRIYDISLFLNIELIQSYLKEKCYAWTERGKLDESKMKNDLILLPEKLLIEKLTKVSLFKIGDCEIFKA